MSDVVELFTLMMRTSMNWLLALITSCSTPSM